MKNIKICLLSILSIFILGVNCSLFENTSSSPPPVISEDENHVPITISADINTKKNIAVNILLEATDVDENPLIFTIADNPSYGILSGISPNLVYTPDNDFVGSDCFTFSVNDGFVDSNLSTINIIVEDIDSSLFISQITQFGITWIFDKEYQFGQFANGDYWVVGPLKIIKITPSSSNIDGRTMNGAMINPTPANGTTQGYDSHLYGNNRYDYDSKLNVALDVSSNNPLIIETGSLVSSISNAEPGARPQFNAMAVLTIVNSALADGSFRPPYCGEDKSVQFNKSNLDYTLLQKLSPVSGTPDLAKVEENFEYPWIDHIPGWTGDEYFHHDHMPNYGREMGTDVGVAALMLHLDFTNEEKETLLIRFVQLGIDNYQITQEEGGTTSWLPNGGHMSSRPWPIIFAGLMLADENMKNICSKSGDYLYSNGHGPGDPPSDYIHFGELSQTFYVTQDDVDRTNSPQWDPDERVYYDREPYTTVDIGLPEWGIEHASRPYRDNKAWNTAYRTVTGIAWNGYILASYIMDSESYWNNNALLGYQDRYMSVMNGESGRSSSDFTENMWDTHRANYGPIWGE